LKHDSPHLVNRTVVEVAENSGNSTPSISPESFNASVLADAAGAVKVLLGNPGMGKSTLLKHLSISHNGTYIPANDFLECNQPQEPSKILYLDGLDELKSPQDARAIRQKLREQPHKGYVLSSRALDWTPTEQDQWGKLSATKLKTYHLQALSDQDIHSILVTNHKFTEDDSKRFLDSLRSHGLSELLTNPLTLNLLVKGRKNSSDNVDSKSQLYERACLELAQELNPYHDERAKSAGKLIIPQNKVLLAAGYLSLIHLCSGSKPFSLFESNLTHGIPIQDLANQDQLPLREALESRLFNCSSSTPTQFYPAHRTIAEYLAAKYVAEKSESGLLIERIVASLLSPDGVAVSPTRGLLAWMASLIYPKHDHLTLIDPIGLVEYGDCKNLSDQHKQRLIEKILVQPTRDINELFYRDFRQSLTPLIHEGWLPHLHVMLDTKNLSAEQSQEIRLACAALEKSSLNAEQAQFVYRVLRDDRLPSDARVLAMSSWIGSEPHAASEKIPALISQIAQGDIADSDDELAGYLLNAHYPQRITHSSALQLLHDPKKERVIGLFRMFWNHWFIERTRIEDLPLLMDELQEWKFSKSLKSIDYGSFFWTISSQALPLVLEHHGDTVLTGKLYSWLELPIGDHRHLHTDGSNKDRIRNWLNARPSLIAELIAYGIKKECSDSNDTSLAWWDAIGPLHGINTAFLPPDFWLRMLEISSPGKNDVTHRQLLHLAQRASNPEFYYPHFEQWFAQRPHLQALFDQNLSNAIEIDAEERERQQQRKAAHQDGIKQLISELHKPFDQVASYALYQVSWAWLGHFTDADGNDGKERLTHLLGSTKEAEHAENALILSLGRHDLPETEKILKGRLSQPTEMYRLSPAMLVACEILFHRDRNAFHRLSDALFSKALMAQFCYGNEAPQAWWQEVRVQRPHLFSATFQSFIRAHFKAKQSQAFGLHHLAHEPQWIPIAKLISHELLESVPVKIALHQLNDLAYLLKAGLRALTKANLLALCAKKISKRSMDEAQRIYWMTSGLILDEEAHLAPLVAALSGREIMVRHFTDLMHSRRHAMNASLSPETLVRLISVCSPYAQPDWGGGSQSGMVTITKSIECGDMLRQWLNELSQDTSDTARSALEGLNQELSSTRWHSEIQYCREQQLKKWREESYSSLTAQQLDAILKSNSPQSRADFDAIALHTLKNLIHEIEDGRDDYWKQFWNVDQHGRADKPKPEPQCRNALAALWRKELQHYGISLNHEQELKNSKLVDIWLEIGDFGLPIEAKRDSHSDLWKAVRTQLIDLYVIDPSTNGRGVYLVFWFGGSAIPTHTFKPKTPVELKFALEKQLHDHEKELIKIFVINLDQREKSKVK
jgi:hypothetical protein